MIAVLGSAPQSLFSGRNAICSIKNNNRLNDGKLIVYDIGAGSFAHQSGDLPVARRTSGLSAEHPRLRTAGIVCSNVQACVRGEPACSAAIVRGRAHGGGSANSSAIFHV